MNTNGTARSISLVFAAALAAIGVGAQAAQPLITDDTVTQGTGHWRLELSGYDGDLAGGGDIEYYRGIVSYGLGQTLDLQFGAPWYRSGEDGVGDTAVGLKWRFYERNALSFALKPALSLPTGDEHDGHGTGKPNLGLRGIVSWTPGAISAHGHVGYRSNENKLGQRESLDEYAAAVGYQISSVRFVGEMTSEANPVRGGDRIRYSTLGVIWLATRDLDVDAGWRQGHGGAPEDDLFTIGATIRW